MEIEGWRDYGPTTRVCPKCRGTEMVWVDARDDTPPKNAHAAVVQWGCVIYWIVWCDCRDGYV